MDYLTEEELFELQYQDEMDILEDMEYRNRKFAAEKSTPNKSKGNIPLSSLSKRKLSFSDDYTCCNDAAASNIKTQSVTDFAQCSESLLEERSKQILANSSDDIDDDSCHPPPAKKSCLSLDETLDNFLSNVTVSQARSSLFDEVRTFSRDQQMLTCFDGQRKYYNISEEEDIHMLFSSFSQKTNSLLATPIDVLKTHYFIMEEKNKSKQLDEIISTSTDEVVIEEPNIESALWVEKYRPNSYVDLLSDEGINRTLLLWLKLWDKVVFGKDIKVKKKKEEPKKNFSNKQFKKIGELIEELDQHHRPHHKVAFLSGPPGLGKTTLAVIIAKHAGYNVVELNASDDRNPETFRTNLEAATQMKAVLHKDHRPNCLILDEIDGAPAPSINVLLSFIKSSGYTKGKRRKGDIPLLMRPIICICNDPYTAALRPLRQLSLVLNFPPTTTTRLSSRLSEILIKEGLTAETDTLNLLCEKSSNDIRSCLSTLQFIYRMKNCLKVSDLEGLTIGQKDMQKNMFEVWQDVFHCDDHSSFDKIHDVVQSFGDYDKVYIGIFENYLNVKLKYRNAANIWLGADWLCFGDLIQQQIAHNQMYLLLPYLPYPAVAFHLMFSRNAYNHIIYPTAYYEYKSKIPQLSNTLTSMVKDMVSTLKFFMNSSTFLLDIFPFLQEIIKPCLRPVNTQLYSERERKELRRVIELMLAFDINYRQERLPDGTYTYILDPNIEELTKFPDITFNKSLTYSTKQMIAREVEIEQLRKENTLSKPATVIYQSKSLPVSFAKKDLVRRVIEKPELDFFGRKKVESAKTKKKTKEDTRDEVWFHFKEGYSNAVRKTVYIKDLL